MRLARSFGALLLALIVAVALIKTAVVIPEACALLDPNGWLYWALGCGGGDTSGGGGSGAGD